MFVRPDELVSDKLLRVYSNQLAPSIQVETVVDDHHGADAQAVSNLQPVADVQVKSGGKAVSNVQPVASSREVDIDVRKAWDDHGLP